MYFHGYGHSSEDLISLKPVTPINVKARRVPSHIARAKRTATGTWLTQFLIEARKLFLLSSSIS
jgi:hypothetical protein